MTLITGVEGTRLLLEVTDTGMGIDSEHFPKTFSHGFTTEASGQSPGIGRGATFTLSLPFQPAKAHT
jgi:signal transduction histidine kinase